MDGVVEVNSFGGYIKQYEVAISPDKLNSQNVSISQVYEALARNNVNTGGAYIEKNRMSNFIRGEGLIRSLEDIRKVVVKTENNIPVTIGDIASKVHFGHQVRYGAFTQDGKGNSWWHYYDAKGLQPQCSYSKRKSPYGGSGKVTS